METILEQPTEEHAAKDSATEHHPLTGWMRSVVAVFTGLFAVTYLRSRKTTARRDRQSSQRRISSTDREAYFELGRKRIRELREEPAQWAAFLGERRSLEGTIADGLK